MTMRLTDAATEEPNQAGAEVIQRETRRPTRRRRPEQRGSEEHTVSRDDELLELRVILVGRTGLDGRLRLDPAIELVRAPTAYDAIGELADPIDAYSPERAFVIVSPDAEPPADRASELVAALRHIDPDVRVLRVVESASEAAGDPAPYHGLIERTASARTRSDTLRPRPRGAVESSRESTPAGASEAAASPEADSPLAPLPDAPVTDFLAAAETGSSEQGQGRSHESPLSSEPDMHNPVSIDPPPSDKPVPAAPAASAPGDVVPMVDEMIEAAPLSSGPAGDERLIDLIARSEEVRGAAVDLIRSRVGADDIEFVPDFLTGEQEETYGARGALVTWRGLRYGWLRSKSLAAQGQTERLRPHAGWLGGWLYLGELHTELRLAAFTDMLTGAWNRRYFDRFLDSAIRQGKDLRRSVTLLLFDIDDFKSYNDRYGHGAGDEILTETVRLLKSVIRPTDRVCRIGGDEFAVIFHEPEGPRETASAHPKTAEELARRFQDQIAKHRFPKLGAEAPGKLTISGGLATFPWDGRNAAELVERADELALQGKRAGKNVIFFGPEASSDVADDAESDGSGPQLNVAGDASGDDTAKPETGPKIQVHPGRSGSASSSSSARPTND